MLILTRQIDEAITIGDEIEITVVEIKGGKVRLGIKAPRTVSIHRKEIYLKIKEQNIGSSMTGTSEADLAGAALISQFSNLNSSL